MPLQLCLNACHALDRIDKQIAVGTQHDNLHAALGDGATVFNVEVVADQRGDTFRAVYTVKFDAAVYVLHVFQKKSKRGAETPMPDISLINARLKTAEEHHKESNS